METKFLPHNFIPNCVVLTGSHDNDTTRSYFETAKGEENDIYKHTQMYLNYFDDDVVNELIRTAYASVANIVIIPMQDVLNLGGQARMNFPSRLGGNWTWRFTREQINENIASHFKGLAVLYERPPKKKKKSKPIKVEEE
jgi:4-alpha-glucanotransferase